MMQSKDKICKTHQYLLTHGMQKVAVESEGHEGVRQLSEPTFNQTCDGVDRVVI